MAKTTKATITLKDGTTAEIKGLAFTPNGADDITLIAHRDIARFGKGWMVTEPITGSLIFLRARTTRANAIGVANAAFNVAGAADFVRNKINAARK